MPDRPDLSRMNFPSRAGAARCLTGAFAAVALSLALPAMAAPQAAAQRASAASAAAGKSAKAAAPPKGKASGPNAGKPARQYQYTITGGC